MENGKGSEPIAGCKYGDITHAINNGDSMKKTKSTSQKRPDYLSWDEYFMAIAFLSAQRSKDPRTQVGACIVNEENKIVGIGYNGMPIGCSDDVMPWGRDSDNILETKQLYVCHAELNAVLNKNAADVRKSRIYVALFPCNECAKIVIQSGIKEVIYYSDKYADKNEFKAARWLLSTAGIKLRQYQPEHRQIVIDFETIEKNMKSDSVGPASTNQQADSDLANKMLQMDVSAAATSFIHA